MKKNQQKKTQCDTDVIYWPSADLLSRYWQCLFKKKPKKQIGQPLIQRQYNQWFWCFLGTNVGLKLNNNKTTKTQQTARATNICKFSQAVHHWFQSHCAKTSLAFQKNCKQILVLLTSRLNVSFGKCSFSRTSEELPIISMNSDTGWSSNALVPVTNPHGRSLQFQFERYPWQKIDRNRKHKQTFGKPSSLWTPSFQRRGSWLKLGSPADPGFQWIR